jgi:hypothetical protein
MPDEWNVAHFAACGALLSGVAGIAWLLRSDQQLTARNVSSVLLNGSILGAALVLLTYGQLSSSPTILLGMCALAGLGGLAAVNQAVSLFQGLADRYLQNKINQALQNKVDRPMADLTNGKRPPGARKEPSSDSRLTSPPTPKSIAPGG